VTTLDSLSSIVKYSRDQSTLSPMRRIWRVMVAPDSGLPVPHLGDEVLAAQVVARQACILQLAFDHDLRGDAGVVGARHPQRQRVRRTWRVRAWSCQGTVKSRRHAGRVSAQDGGQAGEARL
jgi:hypothetical protein